MWLPVCSSHLLGADLELLKMECGTRGKMDEDPRWNVKDGKPAEAQEWEENIP